MHNWSVYMMKLTEPYADVTGFYFIDVSRLALHLPEPTLDNGIGIDSTNMAMLLSFHFES